MITPKLSFEPRERAPYASGHAYFHPSFFRGEMRRSWPKTVCYTLLLFFVLPLPLLFEINSRHTWKPQALSESLTRLLNEGIWLYCFAVVAIAVFAGMLATRYLCRRVSVDYYHSLPIRREGLLIQNWLSGFLHFAMALVFNVLLALLIIMSGVEQLGMIGAPIGKLMLASGYMLLIFLLFYTMTVFCGMLCGTSFMQVAVTGLFLLAYPLFRLLYLAFCNMVTDTVDIGYFIDGNWGWTSPLIRLFYLSQTDNQFYMTPETEYSVYALEQPFVWWEILLWLLAAVALFFGALLLYRLRHVERAGTPVVFGGVATAVKWVVILLATMAMGWLFGEIGNGVFWLFFGFLLGGFLSFLLINTILTKNPKQMFLGWRVLIIYLVAFCIGSVGLGFAVEKIEDTIPKKIDRLTICFENDNYSVPYYTDPEVIAQWRALWQAEIEGDATLYDQIYAETIGYEVVTDEKLPGVDIPTYRFGNRRIAISAYAKVGPFVIPYRQRAVIRENAEPLIRAMTESAEFEAGWDAMMTEMGRNIITNENLEVAWSGGLAHVEMLDLFELVYHYREVDRIGSIGTASDSRLHGGSSVPIKSDILDAIIGEQSEDIGFDFFQSPVYANIECESVKREYAPRLSSDNAPRNTWYQYRVGMNTPVLYREVLGLSEDEFYDRMADFVLEMHGGVYIARRVEGEFTLMSDNVAPVTDHAQIVEILRGLSQLHTTSGSHLSPFTVLDESYGVIFPNGSRTPVYFIKGKIPAFVTATLG